MRPPPKRRTHIKAEEERQAEAPQGQWADSFHGGDPSWSQNETQESSGCSPHARAHAWPMQPKVGFEAKRSPVPTPKIKSKTNVFLTYNFDISFGKNGVMPIDTVYS